MSKAVCCLGIYAVITTIIIAILSWIISDEVACSQVNNVTGTDNKIKTSTNYEFLNFDNRRSKDGDENCSCSSWGFLGIEAFEFMVIGVFSKRDSKTMWGRRLYSETQRDEMET